MIQFASVQVDGLHDAPVALDDGAVIPLDAIGFPGALLARRGLEVWLEYGDLEAFAAWSAEHGGALAPAVAVVTFLLKTQTDTGARETRSCAWSCAQGGRCVEWLDAPEFVDDETSREFLEFVRDSLDVESILERFSVADLMSVTSSTTPLDGDPDASGSKYVSVTGCPQLVAMALTGGMSPQQREAFMFEVRRRAGRGVTWRVGDRPYSGRYDPWIMHRGYRSKGGGWKKMSNGKGLFSSAVPMGVHEQAGTAEPGHATHGEMELLVGAAVLLRSTVAAGLAWGTWQTWMALRYHGETWTSRAYGRALRSAAMLLHVPGIDRAALLLDVRRVVDDLLAGVKGGMPCPDNDTNTAYHINRDQLDALLVKLGIDPAGVDAKTKTDLCRSDVAWMVTQLWWGLESVDLAVWSETDDTSLGPDIRLAKEVCEAFLLDHCRALALNVTTGDWHTPASSWEDRATLGPLARGGESHADALGVMGEFWAPIIVRMARERPGRLDELLTIVRPVLAVCDQERRWGGEPEANLLRAVLESQAPIVTALGHLPPWNLP